MKPKRNTHTDFKPYQSLVMINFPRPAMSGTVFHIYLLTFCL